MVYVRFKREDVVILLPFEKEKKNIWKLVKMKKDSKKLTLPYFLETLAHGSWHFIYGETISYPNHGMKHFIICLGKPSIPSFHSGYIFFKL